MKKKLGKLVKNKKNILSLICISLLLSFFFLFDPPTQRNYRLRDVTINNDVMNENNAITENDVMNENNAITENDVAINKMYPDWVMANYSRESPFSRTLSRQYPSHSAWTAKGEKFLLGSVWPQPQIQQNVESEV